MIDASGRPAEPSRSPVARPRDGDPLAGADAFEQAISRLLLLERRLFAAQLEHFELTPAQYHALIYISRQPQACSMGCLAEHLHQSSATTTGLVDRLVRRNLAERRADSGDRRRVMVCVTEPGLGLLARARAERRQRTVYLLASLAPSDRERLVGVIEVYVERITWALGEMEHPAP